ncbi:nucleotidyl transferase [Catenovulum agarivorans DS-2]|uniref:Nucleotidyl transferase n=1 Tax=Catenovulum agarivorans DS-2 TaxID=1328313 RepID=W7QW37_9ALTE|nr:phosphocholine cytidylyltransferase family protein [Catenovulum agarivorans]EWH09495.1 nucleotidyl transferase [Catenovulum agarivorans DS-2]
MKAIILAAGQGSRLRPYTDNKPKALVELFGKPLLEYQIEALKAAGVSDISIVTGYKGEQFNPYGKVVRNPNYLTSNMVASLFCAQSLLENLGCDLIISYGDIVYQQDTVKTLISDNSPISLVADKGWLPYWQRRMENPLEDAESFILAPNGSIAELGKKTNCYENIQAQYIGLIKLSQHIIPKILDFYQNLSREQTYDGKDFDNMYMTSFIQLLINDRFEVRPVFIERGWVEIDTCEDLEDNHAMASLSACLA